MSLSIKDLKKILGQEDKPKKEKVAVNINEENTRLFTNLSIETGSYCNRRCAFCPQSVDPRDDEWMTVEVFELIVEQLASIRYNGRITLTAYNEPTRDERLPDLIRHLKSKLPRTHVLFNTNGDYIKKPEDIEKFLDAGLCAMQVNVYSAADGCRDHEKIEKGIEKAEKRYAQLDEIISRVRDVDRDGKVYQHGGGHTRIVQLERKWNLQQEDVADHSNLAPSVKHKSSVRNHISNRCGSIPDFVEEMPAPMKAGCTRPFRATMINWRGDVYLCCNDYYGEAIFGNVKDRSIVELFNDPRYHAYRLKLQNKDRNIFLCDKCDYAGGFYTHMITHVTTGDTAEDARLLGADLRSREAAGFSGPLVTLRKRDNPQ